MAVSTRAGAEASMGGIAGGLSIFKAVLPIDVSSFGFWAFPESVLPQPIIRKARKRRKMIPEIE